MAAVTNEHTRLLAQMASGTNNGGIALPPGYIRKTHAKFVGCNSPEDTLQSFLWAVQNRDVATLRQLMTPSMAQQMGVPSKGESGESYFNTMSQLPGLAVVNRRSLPEGSVELEVQIAPGGPTAGFTFHLVDGQWKLGNEF
jgi:hypothetical protein